ncbi:MAG: ATP-dependent RNA helicase RhlB [Pelotomaculum sp. PtaU1.Bin035]|nr:MAG: ATP-dependent RNA helicase RhlB [Pelotomaculum sp. PtaU1.Bin035]
MGRAFLNGLIKKVLIVAPSSVVPAWTKDDFGEFAVHANFPYEVKALEGPIEKRIKALEEWPQNQTALQVTVTNYEATWRMEEVLKKWSPDMIICDESQRIKTPNARQSKTMHRLGRLAKYRLILTGTPVTQGPLDFYSQYKFLDPSIFGTSFVNFRSRYALLGGPNGKMVVGYRNLNELVEKAHRVAFRVSKEEALDLPPFTDQILFCELEPKARRLYEQMRKESVAEILRLMEDETLENNKVIAQNVLTRLLRLSQITGGFVAPEGGNVEQVSWAKFDLLRETVDGLLEAGKKIVIFANFVPEIKAICTFLENISVKYSIIYGGIPQNQRGEMVTRFQQDPEVTVFVCQIRAGLGITLTAAHMSIFYSFNYSFADYDQCKARLDRISQKFPGTHIHLIAENTIDEKILKVLRGKKSVADAVVDHWREFL